MWSVPLISATGRVFRIRFATCSQHLPMSLLELSALVYVFGFAVVNWGFQSNDIFFVHVHVVANSFFSSNN